MNWLQVNGKIMCGVDENTVRDMENKYEIQPVQSSWLNPRRIKAEYTCTRNVVLNKRDFRLVNKLRFKLIYIFYTPWSAISSVFVCCNSLVWGGGGLTGQSCFACFVSLFDFERGHSLMYGCNSKHDEIAYFR